MNGVRKTHTLDLTDRSTLCITGVSELIAFDEDSVILDVGGSELHIGGSSLSVSRLSLESGEIDVTGKVDSIIYAESAPKSRSLVSRLLGRE